MSRLEAAAARPGRDPELRALAGDLTARVDAALAKLGRALGED